MEIKDIRKACTSTLVIGLLRQGPMHGYQMAKEIDARSRGYFELKHATLYPTLHRLEKRGLVAGRWETRSDGRPRKHYRLTAAGAAYHERNAADWRQLFAAMAALIPEVAR